ncbi:MAG TPA: hypothetical protein PKX58_10400 [Flexilinea sp.]|jgi:photosystem II stability/assembly factor-like uncharacterized protein|nr:hypothetical protein [Flexilinea sp.]HPJ65874.1 hypothetical protein [Flexilinea sp.]HPR71245.1 hypothetical protein [Flexilinea sp.]HQF80937.1 hypothetical protein [Flexilinea sp.]HQJ01944.1 hypothetical protein [Flexilinea sp.]
MRKRKFRNISVSTILLFGIFFLIGCKVQVYDLQPVIATGTPVLSAAKESQTLVMRNTSGPLPAVTNTPPIHIAPTRIGESVPIEILELVMINGGSGWGIGKVANGQDKIIVKTTNGGANWKNVSSSQAVYENAGKNKEISAWFLDSNQAWVVYWDNENWSSTNQIPVWKTTDSGGNWEKSILPTEGYSLQYFKDVQIRFIDPQIGWVFAKMGKTEEREYIGLFTTHDGGRSWNLMVSPDSVNLPSKGGKNGAVFRNATEGWISGSNAKDDPGSLLWHSIDGGNTWNKQVLPQYLAEGIPSDLLSNRQYSCSLTPPKFVDYLYQYAWMKMVCQGGELAEPLGLLYWTYDGGNSWRVYQLPAAEGSLVFYGIYQGWYSKTAAPGSSYPYEILGTSNGGENWNLIAQTAWKSNLQFITASIGWGVVEYEGHYAMVKTGDGGFTWEQIFPVVDP